MPFSARFSRLDELLHETQAYWQQVAFACDDMPWPELKPALLQLSDEQVHLLDSSPDTLLEWLVPYIPQLSEIHRLSALSQPHHTSLTFPFWLENGIKGRKLEQLKSFVETLSPIDGRWLEWCAGKGHLGRMLAFKGAQQVVSVELQQALCDDGSASAKKQGLPMAFICRDVLKDAVDDCFEQVDHAVALHACGRLHQEFLVKGVQARCTNLIVSPCCYHLFTPNEYEPMSVEGRSARTQLTHHDMKLALQETVTAPSRLTAVRHREVAWRLGFDALRKSVTGHREYVGVPSVGKQIFSGAFSDFCYWAANQKNIALPDHIDFDAFLALGVKKQQITARIELVRHAFRRAIEIWLVLDRVLYLQSAGYDVEVFEFCDKALTPRNVFINGVLKKEG
jgi:hypothetical protein